VDIEKVNYTLEKAILNFQDGEIESLLERMTFNVPTPMQMYKKYGMAGVSDPRVMFSEYQRIHDELYGAMKKDPADIRKLELPQWYKNYMKELRKKLKSGNVKGDWFRRVKEKLTDAQKKEIASGSPQGRRILQNLGFDASYYGGKEMQDVLISKFKKDLQASQVSQDKFAVASGITSYNVPGPTKKGMPRKRRGLKWKKKTIIIPLFPGTDRATEEKVKAFVLGSWAVHSSIGGARGPVITHIPTGKAIAYARSFPVAKAGVKEMLMANPQLFNLPTEADVLKHVKLLAKWSRDIRQR
jgi:hypothetical protein